MDKGNSNMDALLVVLLLAVLGWLFWYHYFYGAIDLGRLLGF